MQEKTFVAFTKDMIKDYTILVPNMLPMHFEMLARELENYGYNFDILTASGPAVTEAGLKYVHNDACYPAILVIGQFINAIESGRYDPRKVALILFQTGGGCRASNYMSLLRKALEKAGYGYVPVIAFGFSGIEKHPGFDLTLRQLERMLYGIIYGDLLMNLVNQCRPYELEKGSAQALADEWTKKLGDELARAKVVSYKKVKKNYRAVINSFSSLPMERRAAVKVGVVGEIYVKYSPLGNNNLEQFLVDEGAEVVVPGLLDFLLYTVYNGIIDYKVYGRSRASYYLNRTAFDFLCKKKNDLNKAIEENGCFETIMPFKEIIHLAEEYIGSGVKMGEGWLLTAEMLELVHSGIKNIVCVQPFGCLPNHICGKGMMRPIRDNNPDVNIVAVDYDPGASRVNQENRLKLMLSNARYAEV